MNKITICLVLYLSALIASFAQDTPFNIDSYYDFVDQNEDISPAQLNELYPSDVYRDKVSAFNGSDVLYLNDIINTYALTSDEIELLNKNGFVAIQHVQDGSFYDQFEQVFVSDLPVFISSDAILHAFHRSYDVILKEVEEAYLFPQLIDLLKRAHTQLGTLYKKYGNNQLVQAFKDAEIYLAVPLGLMDVSVDYIFPENKNNSSKLRSFINKYGVEEIYFFSDTTRTIDFSQFKPRGHYETGNLSLYFKAMMWLGRMELYLDNQFYDEDELMKSTVNRQILDAALLHEVFSYGQLKAQYNQMEDIISFFVGDQDNITLDRLDAIFDEGGITNFTKLVEQKSIDEFLTTLREQPDAKQMILSQILMGNNDGTVAPMNSAFMLFGQRFVVDSYVTSQIVYDRIVYKGKNICRLFPSTLDIMFTLGNNATTQLLLPELQSWNYSDNLAGLRYLIDQYPQEFWESSLYNQWLNAIRSLNPDQTQKNIPEFMETAAWGLEKLNTQLASWTELRHDNLLYAKQSYTSGVGCSYPYGYVEPIPEFYQRMQRLAQIAAEKFDKLSVFDGKQNNIVEYFQKMESSCKMLENIALKELNTEELNEQEIIFLQEVVYTIPGYANKITGWYADLIYNDEVKEFLKENLLVADYHTTPTDCGGVPIGWVLHAGTGHANMIIVVAPASDGRLCAFAGPVSSYHEYVTTNFQRLTDSEWNDEYLAEAIRPEWVYNYLSDKDGKIKSTAMNLFSSEKEYYAAFGTKSNKTAFEFTKRSDDMLAVMPNPINESALIVVNINGAQQNKPSHICIYDGFGRQVKSLLTDHLSSGNYIIKWNGTDHSGNLVPSGMYFIKLTAGDQQQVVKVMVSR